MVRGSGHYNTRGGRGGSSYYRGSSHSNYRGNSNHSSYDSSYSRGGGHHSNGSSRYTGGSSSYTSSYDSRPSSRYQGSSDRYSSSRPVTYKRPYDSSRDRSSPDRKRSRPDTRRSQDYGSGVGGGSSDYSGRYSGSSGGGNQYNRHHDSRNRGSSTSFRSRDNSNLSQRSRDRMGPPKSVSVPTARRMIRGNTSSTYRGRGAGIRGANNIRRAPRMSIAGRTERLRRRILPTRTQESIRKLKIARLRSKITVRKDKDSGDKSDDNGVKDDTESTTKKSTTDSKSSKGKSSSKKESSTTTTIGPDGETIIETTGKVDEDDDDDDDDDDDNHDGDSKSKNGADKNANEDDDEYVELDEDELQNMVDAIDEDNDDEDDDDMPVRQYQRSFIKLVCVHCRLKCITFKSYTNHLYNRTHKSALRRIALRQKAQLTQMRMAQRQAQRDLDEQCKDDEDMETQFCLLCRLNYRSEKAEHQASESHNKMKRFLMPYCSVCRISFKGPMVYEMHRCSLEHIKRKAAKEAREGGDEREVNLDQFTTVDSIGDVDGQNGEEDDAIGESSDKNDAEKNDGTAADKSLDDGHSPSKKKSSKAAIIVGNEHLKKVEVYYCDLCYYYLPHKKDQETALKAHCNTKSHLRAYVRYRENQNLRLAAEKIHRKHQEKRDARREEKAKSDAKKSETASVAAANTATVTEDDDKAATVKDEDELITGDEKMWEDVDKDLNEILQVSDVGDEEVGNDEDEEATTTERYDRFKNTENNIEDNLKKIDDKVSTVKVKQEPTDKVADKPIEKSILATDE